MKLLNKVKFVLLMLIFTISILTIKTYATTGVITEVTVNLREKPSTDSKKIMYVTQDDEVEILEKSGEWYKIRYKDNTGYVFSKYVKVDEENNEIITKDKEKVENVTEEKEEVVIDTAKPKLKIKTSTKVRIVPSISSNVLYTSKNVENIEIIEQINDWTYVYVNKIYGWVRTDKIVEDNIEDVKINTDTENKKENDDKIKEEKKEEKKEETKKETTKSAYIKYNTVNLRQKASATSKSLAKLKLNDKVEVIEKVDSVWSKVKVDGITGYVSTDLLSDKKQEESKKEEDITSRSGNETSREEPKNSEEKKVTTTNNIKESVSKTENTTNKVTSTKTTGDEIVAFAKKYLGYKYVYGGASPKTGFDCSGFTYYVYKNFGYTLSRSSTAQAKNGKEVSKKDLQPGDLVIYKNTSLTRIGHVGIYIGNNRMIHASEPGVGVVITDIDSKPHKYDKRYVTARRIIK